MDTVTAQETEKAQRTPPHTEMISEDQSRGQVTRHTHINSATWHEQVTGEMNKRKRSPSPELQKATGNKNENIDDSVPCRMAGRGMDEPCVKKPRFP